MEKMENTNMAFVQCKDGVLIWYVLSSLDC